MIRNIEQIVDDVKAMFGFEDLNEIDDHNLASKVLDYAICLTHGIGPNFITDYENEFFTNYSGCKTLYDCAEKRYDNLKHLMDENDPTPSDHFKLDLNIRYISNHVLNSGYFSGLLSHIMNLSIGYLLDQLEEHGINQSNANIIKNDFKCDNYVQIYEKHLSKYSGCIYASEGAYYTYMVDTESWKAISIDKFEDNLENAIASKTTQDLITQACNDFQNEVFESIDRIIQKALKLQNN